jgi:hypothetical protein
MRDGEFAMVLTCDSTAREVWADTTYRRESRHPNQTINHSLGTDFIAQGNEVCQFLVNHSGLAAASLADQGIRAINRGATHGHEGCVAQNPRLSAAVPASFG